MSITNENVIYLLKNQHRRECVEELAYIFRYLVHSVLHEEFGEKYPELLEDMEQQALLDLCKSYHKFDVEKHNNPIVFFQVNIYSSGLWFLDLDGKQSLRR